MAITSRDEFNRQRIEGSDVADSATKLREAIEEAMASARRANSGRFSVYQGSYLPAAVDLVIAEYIQAGWTVRKESDCRNGYDIIFTA